MDTKADHSILKFESGLSKLAVEDWVNGSVMFYITRDPMFGAIGIVGSFMQWFSALPIGTALLTWGTIALECTIAVLLLSPSYFKKYGLIGAIALHSGIAITMGLWSFALAMIGTATVAAYSLGPVNAAGHGESDQNSSSSTPLRKEVAVP